MAFRGMVASLLLVFAAGCVRGQSLQQLEQESLRDHQTGILYRIEPDRRHVWAISNGFVLWKRDCTCAPLQTISQLRPANGNTTYFQAQKLNPSDYLQVSWNLGFGLIRKSDGNTIYLGQD